MHPKTGKVCVPLDPATADDFDPDTVPTVHTLLQQLGPKDKEAAQQVGARTKVWEISRFAMAPAGCVWLILAAGLRDTYQVLL